MFLTERKLERRIQELQEYRYRDVQHLERFYVKEDTEKKVNPEVPGDFTSWENMETGQVWSGRDRYLWLHRELQVPQQWKGRQVLGIFDFGNTGAGNNSGFESLLYLDKEPYQGVDANHKEVFLGEETCGKTVDATFRLWSGLEGGGIPKIQEHRINRADLAWLDEEADDLYYLGSLVLDTVRCLEAFDPTRYQLQNALDRAFHCIDWSYPGSEEFYDSVHEADKILNAQIDAMDKNPLVEVKCVGHTHIDVAWLWTLKNTREKCSRSFSTALRLMERYPEYIFLQTQPQLYAYIKEDFPQIYEKIKEKVTSGQWEVDGGMWVEADCNLTSGESLTRQLLLGSRFIKEEFGRDVEYLWLPDVFGYSWALPQILKKSGIDTFMTTKISWNQYNRMPHDTFYWKGIDGSEVLTHFITTPEPWNEPGSWFYTYNGKLMPKTVKGVWDAYSEKDMNQELLICYGYGDGGGGVSRDMLEERRRLDKIPGLPAVKTSTAGEYFRDLQNTVKNTDQFVHTWDGELYLEYHRGTYTSHGYNKRMNRKMEFLYREAEWMTAMDGFLQGDIRKARQEELTKGWKILLTNQFHDIIPGSAIHEVYENCKLDYQEAECIARTVEDSFWARASEEKEKTYTIWNNSGWERTENILLPEKGTLCCTDENGALLPTQETEEGTYVEVSGVPSMGCLSVTVEEGGREAGENPFRVSGKNIETPYYSIKLNQYGQISRLFDKEYQREVLPEGERANVLQMFEDKPVDNDAWDIDIFYQQKMREVTGLQEFTVKDTGPLQLKLHLAWEYGSSRIEQDMVLYRNSRRIDFVTNVDYHETHQLMKAAFPAAVRATYATYDIQYGNVRRPNNWNTSWEQARFETVAHRWADLSERDYGVSLLNDCKYGCDIKDNLMRITLLKAATHPDYKQDQGEHIFTYALLPHKGDFVEGRTVEEAYALNQPLGVKAGKTKLPWNSFIEVVQGRVEIDAVKRAEDGDGLVLRFHEYTGATQQAEIHLGAEAASWRICDMMERPIGEPVQGTTIALNVKPYEIITVLIQQ